MKVHYQHADKEDTAFIDFHEQSVSVRKKEGENTFDYIPTPTGYRFLANGKIYDVTFRTRSEHDIEVFVNNRLVPLKWLDRHHFDYAESGLKTGSKGDIFSIMPGRVVQINVREGDEIQQGQPLLVLEAMKMENEIKAAGSGRVKKVHVQKGASVDSHALLVSLDLSNGKDG